MTRLRCAIYTRKSSEEGLEQSFNSLDAQREACEAYVLSQKGEGWKALPSHYDDGGFSGGTMERPALQALLQDIASGRIDVVVVYKVDRLTRSLTDFARIVEVFDGHGVSFVSVTQAFNTTSSMGRLTLNVLLSFAQFEREVTGERIRDKIAASKAKGMWMGGCAPLGYEPKDRQLVVVPEEAASVRHIFERYLALKSVNALAEELETAGICSKRHTFASGRSQGGTRLGRGALFHLLRNRIYVGEIVHKEQSYPGQHDAIVDVGLFERVQRQLSQNTVQRSGRRTESAPLRGLIYDAAGNRMSPAHALGKSGAKYRYYIANDASQKPRDPEFLTRVSALLVEGIVLDHMRALLRQPAASWPELLPSLRRVEVSSRALILEIAAGPAAKVEGSLLDADVEYLPNNSVRLRVSVCMQPRNGSSTISAPALRAGRPKFDRPLIAALKRSHRELARHGIHFGNGRVDLENARGLDDPYLRQIAPLAFLAPEIQSAILTGRQPPWLTLKQLTASYRPIAWKDQRGRFGI